MERAVLVDKLLKGSLVGILRVGLAVPLYLVLTPFMLSKLGVDMFGLWSFSTIMIGFVSLTDFGFKNSLVRYIAGNLDRHDGINRHFSAAFWLYATMSIFVIFITLLFVNVIVSQLFGIQDRYHDLGVFVLIVSAVSFSIRFLATPFQAVIEGYQEHFYSQFVSLLWLIVNFVGTIIALMITPDLRVLGIVSIAANLLFPVMFIYRVRKRFPFLNVRFGGIDKQALVNLFKFGAGIQVATVLIMLREPIYKIIISHTYGLGSLASFDIAYRLCTQSASIVISPLLGTFAVSALLYNRSDELIKILRPMLGFVLAVFIPATLFFSSFSAKLVSLWIGQQADETAFMLIIVFAAFAIYYTTEPLYKSIEGSGFSGYSAFAQLLSIVFCVAIFVLLSSYGAIAIPASLLAGFSVFSISNYLMFKQHFKKISLIKAKQLLALLVPASGYALITLWLNWNWLPAIFGAYLIIHLVVVIKMHVFDFVGITRKIVSMILNSNRNLGKEID